MAPAVTGTVLSGRYRLDQELASSAEARAYRAWDLRLARPVTIQVLRPELARDPERRERFLRHAQATAMLAHPYVVNVFDVDAHHGPGGQVAYFLVLEWVEGEELRTVLARRGPLPPEEALGLVTQVGLALRAAHRRGIVHGALDTGQVLVAADGRVKVAGFGLARSGHAQDDLYGLGVILYEALTAARPGGGGTDRAAATLPAPLASLVSRAVARRPEDRYPSVDAFLEAVERTRAELWRLGSAQGPGTAGRPAPGAPFPAADTRRPAAERVPSPAAASAGASRSALAGTGAVSGGGAAAGDLEVTQVRRGRTPAPPLGPRATNPAPLGAVAPASVEDLEVTQRLDRVLAGPAGEPGGSSGGPVAEAAAKAVGPQGGRGRNGGRRRSRWSWLLAVALLAAIVGWGAAAVPRFLFPPEVVVPDVVGLSLPLAQRTLANFGLRAQVAREVYDARIPAGRVLAQNPEPRRRVREGRVIQLHVSRGPERLTVPAVVGLPLSEARLRITQAGLQVGTVREEARSGAQEGVVLRQEPGGGSALARGGRVNLVVSAEPPTPAPAPSAPAPAPAPKPAPPASPPPAEGEAQEATPGGQATTSAAVAVPDLRGLTVEQARGKLSESRLALGRVFSEVTSRAPEGAIVAQNPAAGARVEPGSQVDVVYATGREGTEGGRPTQGQEVWHQTRVTVEVPQGPPREVAIVVTDEDGTRDIFRDVVNGGVRLTRAVRGRGPQARVRVYVGGRLVDEIGPCPAGASGSEAGSCW